MDTPPTQPEPAQKQRVTAMTEKADAPSCVLHISVTAWLALILVGGCMAMTWYQIPIPDFIQNLTLTVASVYTGNRISDRLNRRP